MNEPDDLVLHVEAVAVPDDPGDAHTTRVRCASCLNERDVPTHLLPLGHGGGALRDRDGVRLGLCPRCTGIGPNRAARRHP